MDRPAEHELEAWIEDCVSAVRDRQEYVVLRTRSAEFLALYGLIGRTSRFADAYLQLVGLGLSHEAVPLARAALEHAVTAQWVFLVRGGIDRYRVAIARDLREHYTTMAEYLGKPEFVAEVAALGPPPAGKALPRFMEMLRELDQGHFLETSYHMLSQQVHVTHAAVTSFLEPSEDLTHFRYEQDYPYGYQATYVVAEACMLMRWIQATLTGDEDLLGELDKKSDELTLPMNLIESLPAERRRRGL